MATETTQPVAVMENGTQFDAYASDPDVYPCDECAPFYHVKPGGHVREARSGAIYCQERDGFDCCEHLT